MLKRSKVIIGIAVTALVVGGGIAYTLLYSNPYKDWETYRNDEIGYSVKYPKGYHVRIPEEGKDLIVFVENPNFLHEVVFQDAPLIPQDVDISISVYKNPLKLSAEEWVGHERDEELAKRYGVYKSVVVNDVEGIWSEVSGSNGTSVSVVLVKSKDDDRVLAIDGSFDNITPSQALVIFNRFLNSLEIDWTYST